MSATVNGFDCVGRDLLEQQQVGKSEAVQRKKCALNSMIIVVFGASLMIGFFFLGPLAKHAMSGVDGPGSGKAMVNFAAAPMRAPLQRSAVCRSPPCAGLSWQSIGAAIRDAKRVKPARMHASVAKRTALPEMQAGATGPVVIVTGGSRGLGRAIALALGAEGCRVVVNYASSADAAEKVVEEIKGLGGGGVAIQADMSSVEGIKSLFKATAEAFEDPVGVLINNAGITRDTLVLRMKENQWRDVIETNLNGVFFASQAASKIMMKKRAGRIINIASVVGKIGNVGQANYAAAKGGVIAMTKTMAKEFAPRGVTVNAVAPGFIESDMTAELPEDIIEGVKKTIPAGRFGKPEEVAGLVKYLALDPSADYITGHCLNIDGGIAIGTC